MTLCLNGNYVVAITNLGMTSEPTFPFPSVLKESHPFSDPRLSKGSILVIYNSMIQSPIFYTPSKMMREKTTKTTANRITWIWPLEIIEITETIHLVIIHVL